MPTVAMCPNSACGKKLTIPDGSVLQKLRCPACQTRLGDQSIGAPTVTYLGDSDVPRQIGRFRMQKRLGEGAFGVVYRAFDTQLDREIALKVAKPGTLDSPSRIQRFLREAKAAASLRHPNIVPVHDAGRDGDHYYIAAAFIDGQPLAHIIGERGVELRRAVQIQRKLAEAVAYAHKQGIVHRDIKPANVMLDGRDEPLLMDFGLAARTGSEKLTSDGTVMGTPAYMAPEQAVGQQGDAQPAVDQYSLGVVLFELLTGEVPFSGRPAMVLFHHIQTPPPPPSKLRPGLPRDLETICLKALAKFPDDRYADCQAMADDLRRWLDGEPISARRLSATEQLTRWARRNRSVAVMAVLLAAALLTATVVSSLFAIQANVERGRAEVRRLEAESAEARANAEKLRTEEEKNTAQRKTAELAMDRGLGLCERGELGQGLLWLFRSLELAPSEADDLKRVIRANLVGWRRTLPKLLRVPPQSVPGRQPADMSADGKFLFLAGRDRTARLWNIDTGEAIGKPLAHPNILSAAAFSVDGKILMTGGYRGDGICRFWDRESGRLLGQTSPHRAGGPGIISIASSPDGRLAATSAQDATVRLWQMPSGAPFGEPLQHFWVFFTTFSPDGKKLLTTSNDGARLWDVQTTKLIAQLPAAGWPQAGMFSADGQTIMTGSLGSEGRVQFWNASTLQELGRPAPRHRRIAAVVFSPDEKAILTGGYDQTARLWDASTAQPLLMPLPLPRDLVRTSFSRDGKRLFTASGDGSVRIWDLPGPLTRGPELKHSKRLIGAAVRPDGKALLTGSEDGSARLWDLKTGQPLGTPMIHQGAITSLAFSHDGRKAATGGRDGLIRQWDAFTSLPLGPNLSLGDEPTGICYSTDDRRLAAGQGSALGKIAQIWDVASGQPIGSPIAGGQFAGCAFSLDGKFLYTANGDRTVGFWDAATGAPVFPPGRHDDAVVSLQISPDGRRLLSGGYDATVRVWETSTGKLVEPIIQEDAQAGASYSPDAKFILTFATGKTARIWDAGTHKLLSRPMGSETGLSVARGSPDGRLVATGGTDSYARLWDAALNVPLGPPMPHPSNVRDVQFTPDSATLITACNDGAARLWPIEFSAELDEERWRTWVEVVAAIQLDDKGAVQVLPLEEWNRRRARLDELGGPPRE